MVTKYLDQKLTFDGNKSIYDGYGKPVMMDWEAEWMDESAKIICSKGGRVLNIGFGLGIIDTFIQTYPVEAHYICEPHPDILKKMKTEGWYNKPNVHVIPFTWQEGLKEGFKEKFDSIYFDAYDMLNPHDAGGQGFFEEFIPLLPKLLKKDGIFSFWAGPIYESNRAVHIQFRNLLMKALQPTFQLEKKYYKYNDTELTRERFKYTNQKRYTIPVITYRKVPLKVPLI
tara:strand:- start:61 stop:744 length:684 start_codon:yes stop_codon:yes gene_type:complete